MNLDPDIISKWDQSRGIIGWQFIPNDVHVLEVIVYSDSPPRVHERRLDPAEFLEWIDEKSSPSPPTIDSQSESDGTCLIIGELRLIFTQPVSPDPGSGFPLDQYFPDTLKLPFAAQTLQHVEDRLQLPRLTCDVALNINEFKESGITRMLVPFYGNNLSNGLPRGGILSLSHVLSHRTAVHVTNAILFGVMQGQLASIRDAIRSMAAIASNPAFLPAVISHFRAQRCFELHRILFARVVDLETASGLGQPAYIRGDGVGTIPIGNCDKPEITKDAANTTVAAIRAEAEVESLVLVLCELQGFLRTYEFGDKGAHPDWRDRQTHIIQSHLTTLTSRVQQSRLRVSECRARLELQLTAVLRLLNKTRLEKQIAQEARKDSSAMKSIAVLTMTFLPATYIATLFATPGISETGPSQALYWGVSLPVTGCVLVIWFLWTWLSVRSIERSGPTLPGMAREDEESTSPLTRRQKAQLG